MKDVDAGRPNAFEEACLLTAKEAIEIGPSEYQEIGSRRLEYLEEQREAGVEVTEAALVCLRFEQVEKGSRLTPSSSRSWGGLGSPSTF